ncbi:MAG: Holliday junction branch migration protein RuvA [Candidatus Latescibacterota bacterium]
MIAQLQGKLVAKEPRCVLSVAGVGYELNVPQKDIIELRVGDPDVTFQTYLYVREDRLTLYGFLRSEDRELFARLIEVSGIGPKTALNMFAAHPSGHIVAAIRKGDISFLKSLPGLGKKTAERLVMELGEKLSDLSAAPAEQLPENNIREEVILALASLGMTRVSAEKAMEKIDWKSDTAHDVEQIVREALKFAGSI